MGNVYGIVRLVTSEEKAGIARGFGHPLTHMKALSSALVAVSLMILPSFSYAASLDEFCGLVNKSQQDLAAALSQMKAETNPLKQDNLRRKYADRCAQVNKSVNDVFKTDTMDSWHGRVVGMEAKHYSQGPGFELTVMPACATNTKIILQFNDITNRDYAGTTTRAAPMAPYRTILEDLALNDVVSWSGRFTNIQPWDVDRSQSGQIKFEVFSWGMVTNFAKGETQLRAPNASLSESQSQTTGPAEATIIKERIVGTWRLDSHEVTAVETFNQDGTVVDVTDGKRTEGTYSFRGAILICQMTIQDGGPIRSPSHILQVKALEQNKLIATNPKGREFSWTRIE